MKKTKNAEETLMKKTMKHSGNMHETVKKKHILAISNTLDVICGWPLGTISSFISGCVEHQKVNQTAP